MVAHEFTYLRNSGFYKNPRKMMPLKIDETTVVGVKLMNR